MGQLWDWDIVLLYRSFVKAPIKSMTSAYCLPSHLHLLLKCCTSSAVRNLGHIPRAWSYMYVHKSMHMSFVYKGCFLCKVDSRKNKDGLECTQETSPNCDRKLTTGPKVDSAQAVHSHIRCRNLEGDNETREVKDHTAFDGTKNDGC